MNKCLFLILRVAVAGSTWAATPTESWVLPSDAARIKTIGTACPGGWNLWSSGELGDFVQVEREGVYRLAVTAWGSQAYGIWPAMSVTVDGTQVAITNVPAAARVYEFPLHLAAGPHRLTVAFLNDAVAPNGDDRNLFVARLELRAPAATPPPRPGDPQEWCAQRRAAEQEREDAIIAESAEAIERLRKSDCLIRVLDAQGLPVASATVAATQTNQTFLFGCNIYMLDRYGNERENALYRERFRDLFNYATVGFYWRSYEPERGKPHYAYTDKVVAWCQANGIAMKGHPLLWNNEHGTPRWVSRKPDAALMQARVDAIIGRYKEAIHTWEVVNEPAHLPGLDIDDPYRWARAADPRAHLVVNDFQVMADGCPAFYALLKQKLAAGVPFDGIGIQAHEPRTMRFRLDSVRATLDSYAALGKSLHITEFTPASSGDAMTGSRWGDCWDEAAQAEYAVKFYTVCYAHPAVRAITWWDLCDHGSWLKGGGLLRADLTPKPAYDALQHLVREQWITKSTGLTDARGEFNFRGFHGAYTVTVNNRKSHSLTLAPTAPARLDVRLP